LIEASFEGEIKNSVWGGEAKAPDQERRKVKVNGNVRVDGLEFVDQGLLLGGRKWGG